MPRGGKRPGAGRPRGRPNRTTAEGREVFKRIFENLAPEVEGWIREQAATDAGKGADLVLKMAEYHLPKLARSDVTVKNLTDEALYQELKRREEEETAVEAAGVEGETVQ